MKTLNYRVTTRISEWQDEDPKHQHRQLLRWMQANFGKPYDRWYTHIDENGHTVVHVDTEDAAIWVTLRWAS